MHGSQPPAPPRFSITEKSVVVINKAAVKKMNLTARRHALISYDRPTRMVLMSFSEKPVRAGSGIVMTHEMAFQTTGQATLGIKKILNAMRAPKPTKTKLHEAKDADFITFKIE